MVLKSNWRDNLTLPVDCYEIIYATLGDIEALVVLHLHCFSANDHSAVMFGEDLIRAAYKWFVTDTGTFALAANIGDQLIGFTALADKPYNRPMVVIPKRRHYADSSGVYNVCNCH